MAAPVEVTCPRCRVPYLRYGPRGFGWYRSEAEVDICIVCREGLDPRQWLPAVVAGLLLLVLVSGGCHMHSHPKVQSHRHPDPDATDWTLSGEAKDTDRICLPLDQADEGWRRCTSVGEVRAFMRSARAEP